MQEVMNREFVSYANKQLLASAGQSRGGIARTPDHDDLEAFRP